MRKKEVMEFSPLRGEPLTGFSWKAYVVVLIAWLLFAVLLYLPFCLAGCAVLDRLAEPNMVAPAGRIITAAGAIATSTGQPWGIIVTGLAGGLTTFAAIYRNYRNQIKSAKKYQAIEITTKAIVDAIETTAALPAKDGMTIGDLIKTEVKTKLSDKDWYKTGKALISSLKGS